MKDNMYVVFAYILTIALTAVFIAIVNLCFPARAFADAFVPAPKDRPVLESVQQVAQAMATGVCEFDFDGVHYVIADLPKEYVAYSAWYCRMP